MTKPREEQSLPKHSVEHPTQSHSHQKSQEGGPQGVRKPSSTHNCAPPASGTSGRRQAALKGWLSFFLSLPFLFPCLLFPHRRCNDTPLQKKGKKMALLSPDRGCGRHWVHAHRLINDCVEVRQAEQVLVLQGAACTGTQRVLEYILECSVYTPFKRKLEQQVPLRGAATAMMRGGGGWKTTWPQVPGKPYMLEQCSDPPCAQCASWHDGTYVA